ncbi:MAG: AAA domain-containing protein [Halobacteriota archaeon]
MDVRGTVTSLGSTRSVSTRYGDRMVGDVYVDGEEVTLWGDWTETLDWLTEGMEVACYDVDDGGSTTSDSRVVVEPDYVVDVTDVREWVQCPRMQYLSKATPTPLNYPVVKGTLVHEVFEDLLDGVDVDEAVERRVAEREVELELAGVSTDEAAVDVREHAGAIQGWLQQTSFEEDGWRSEVSLASARYGVKGRCDALRRGRPVELKTGKSVSSEPYFQDKIQVALYALLLGERGVPVSSGSVLYTKNATLDRSEGDVSPAKEFRLSDGLLNFALRKRNEVASMCVEIEVPTGHEADADCDRCFERDTCMAVAGRLDQESKAGRLGEAVSRRTREFYVDRYEDVERRRRELLEEFGRLSRGERSQDYSIEGLEPLGCRRSDGGFVTTCSKPPESSKIREGDVVLASRGRPLHGERARVRALSPERIELEASVELDVSRVDVYPSEYGFDGELSALHDFCVTGTGRSRRVFFGEVEPSFEDVEMSVDAGRGQTRAVERAVGADDVCLVRGPPGTGKTYTIARMVVEMVKRGERVLLSSYTNRAVDNALEALLEAGDVDVVRVGTEHGVREDMRGLMAGSVDVDVRDADVVAATTSSCGSRVMRELEFDRVVLDEASQLTDTAALPALNRGRPWVLVGDDRQLPPVDGDGSVFERLLDRYPSALVELRRQYRMAARIQAFSAMEFYDGDLIPASEDVARRSLDDLDGVDVARLPEALDDTVCFVDVESSDEGNVSVAEARRVADVINDLVEAGVRESDVGVIAPFRAQASEVRARVPEGVAVDTVDRFQGSSSEVVVVSFAASGDLESPVFDDERRLNVALSRAKRLLVLVGDVEVLSSRPLYARMVDWAEGGNRTG